MISVDNGTEFTSRSLDHWAYWNRVRLDFSRPGKPTDNAHIEAFNSVLRRECLSQHWFIDIEDAQRILDHWRADYNNFRPHGSLARSTPADFAAGAPFTLGLKSSKTRISSGPTLGASAEAPKLASLVDQLWGQVQLGPYAIAFGIVVAGAPLNKIDYGDNTSYCERPPNGQTCTLVYAPVDQIEAHLGMTFDWGS